MELKETNVLLRKLTADVGKVIISKETQKDEKGKEIPVIQAKEIYLGKEDSQDNYIEIEENKEESEEENGTSN